MTTVAVPGGLAAPPPGVVLAPVAPVAPAVPVTGRAAVGDPAAAVAEAPRCDVLGEGSARDPDALLASGIAELGSAGVDDEAAAAAVEAELGAVRPDGCPWTECEHPVTVRASPDTPSANRRNK